MKKLTNIFFALTLIVLYSLSVKYYVDYKALSGQDFLGRASSDHSGMTMIGDINMNGNDIVGSALATTTDFIATGVATSTAFCITGSTCKTSWAGETSTTGSTSTSTAGLMTIAHGLGRIPKVIRITAYNGNGILGNVLYSSVGVSPLATTTQSYVSYEHTGEYGNSTGNSVSISVGSGSIIAANATGKLWDMDATNFYINFTGINNTIYFVWEAE